MYAEFGTDYKIYTEDVPQGITPPCFIVTSIIPLRDKETRVTYRYSQLFAVQYITTHENYEANNYRREFNGIVSRLDDCLENISVEWAEGQKTGTLTKTTDINITDEGVLTYTIRVEDVYFREDNGDLMEQIEINPAEIEVANG